MHGADHGVEAGLRHLGLGGHQAALTLLLHVLGHLRAEGGSVRAVLLEIGEHTHTVEPLGADEVLQLREVRVCLAGEAHDEGGADGDVRHEAAHAVQDALLAGARDPA
ncbi:MAG: hypothetical protein ACK559_16825, partial [bacterium]